MQGIILFSSGVDLNFFIFHKEGRNLLLTITYKGEEAENLGYLLYKNPNRHQVFELNHGMAYVFYPEVSREKTTAALLLDINPLDLTRRREGGNGEGLFDYVNDRPYVASSFLSVAIAKVFGTAMTGKSKEYPELASSPIPLEAKMVMLPCVGDISLINRLFEPLGYNVEIEEYLSDENFPEWGESKYVSVTIRGEVRLCDLLNQIYVLIPVFDRKKHYWMAEDEVNKLIKHGGDWLKTHPERNLIMTRYFNRKSRFFSMALKRLMEDVESEDITADKEVEDIIETNGKEHIIEPEDKACEKHISLNQQRLDAIVAVLKDANVTSVIDLGCGEGKLLALLMKDKSFKRLAGTDVSLSSLQRAKDKLKLGKLPEEQEERLQLFQSSLTYRDKRFEGYDAGCIVEVVEHLDASRLKAFERVVFEFARPNMVIITTPNREYNNRYKNLINDGMRHSDHRFEWTRAEFLTWAKEVAKMFGYTVEFMEIGEYDDEYGMPTQMGVFRKCE